MSNAFTKSLAFPHIITDGEPLSYTNCIAIGKPFSLAQSFPNSIADGELYTMSVTESESFAFSNEHTITNNDRPGE